MRRKGLQVIWGTNEPMRVLAYAQKFIALAIAVYFAFQFIYPVMCKAVNLPNEWVIFFIVFTLVVFELMLHFGLKSWIEGLFRGEFQFVNFLGAVLTFTLIGVLDWYSTDNITYFRTEASAKVALVNIDSLKSAHQSDKDKLQSKFESKEALLDSLNLPILAKTQPYPYAFMEAQRAYQTQRKALLIEKSEAIESLIISHRRSVSDAQKANKIKTDRVEAQDRADAQSTAWLGLVVLLFSLYSTLVIAVFTRQKNQAKPNEGSNHNLAVLNQESPEFNEVQSVDCTEVQSTKHEVQSTKVQKDHIIDFSAPSPTPSHSIVVNVQNMVNQQNDQNAKVSDKRIQATEYYINELENDSDMTDKEKLAILQEEFGISRSTYFNIKRDRKEELEMRESE